MAQNAVWLLVGLLAVAIPVIAFAQRAAVSYPIVLVLAGVVLGLIPGLPQIELDPDLVLVIFLPPLLYWEAINAPTDAMKRHESSIWTLAVGLVIVTTVAVAAAVHAVHPAMPWAMAFVLGAIVAPTDELAATPVLDAMRIPRSLIAIVEGESLLNDATSLILYSAAIGVVLTGTFVWWSAVGWFFVSAIGGAAIGWIAALGARELWRRVRDNDLQIIVSFVLPYFAFLTAGRFGVSSVLAAVFAGIVANRYTPVVVTPESRLQAIGFWNSLVFLTNTVLFLLVGMQLHAVTSSVLVEYSWTTVLYLALVLNLVVIAVRLLWFMGNEYAPGLPLVSGADQHPNWRRALVAAWSGFRGAVSLAAALAIPAVTAAGAPVPARHLVIFLTFTVILVTLVGGGFTLPRLVRHLDIPDADDDESAELKTALRAMREAASAFIDELTRRGDIDPGHAAFLRHRSERRLRANRTDGQREHGDDFEREVLAEERSALVALRNRGEIDNTVLRVLQHKLDLAEAAIPRRS